MTRLTQSAADAMADASAARNDVLTEREVAMDADTHDARIATAAYPPLPRLLIWAVGTFVSTAAVYGVWLALTWLWRVM